MRCAVVYNLCMDLDKYIVCLFNDWEFRQKIKIYFFRFTPRPESHKLYYSQAINADTDFHC